MARGVPTEAAPIVHMSRIVMYMLIKMDEIHSQLSASQRFQWENGCELGEDSKLGSTSSFKFLS